MKARVLHAVTDNGTDYAPGQMFGGDEEKVLALIELGVLANPHEVSEPDVADEATAEAAKIVEDAKVEAEGIVDAAQEAATALQDDAKLKAAQTIESAKQVAADIVANAKKKE